MNNFETDLITVIMPKPSERWTDEINDQCILLRGTLLWFLYNKIFYQVYITNTVEGKDINSMCVNINNSRIYIDRNYLYYDIPPNLKHLSRVYYK